ncbi:MAG: helix-turn-helix transcriptional regulator [Candidatus Gastranaerophilales bacterium]
MDYKKEIGLKVKQYRLLKGYRQSQLAEIVSVEDRTISRIEVGGNYPSVDLMIRISNALDCKLVDLVNFENETINSTNSILTNKINNIRKLVNQLKKELDK